MRTIVTADMEIVASYTCDYPALNVQGFGNGWTVSVKIPEGALPETTMFRVLPVNAEDYRATVESAMGASVGNITAVDLFFVDRFNRSKELEPLKPVTVNVSIPGLDNSKTHSVVHVKDDGDAEVVQSGIEGSKFTFEADQFSIYAVVEDTKILTVNFYDETGALLNTQYIRKVDNTVQNLYNPQWDLEYGTEFYGWAAEEGAVSGADIDEINSSVTTNWDSYTEGVALNYYAVIKKVYVVTFNRYNDANELVVLKTLKVLPEENTITIPGDLSGADLGDQFLGWIAQDGSFHKQDTTYTLNGHMSFFLKETGRSWLVFDANAGGPGSGADYTPPQLIFGEGVVTAKPTDPTRTGYTFLGWNTEADGTGSWWSKSDEPSINEFGTAITADVTLYAQWEGAQTNYYVIYWKQSATDAAGLANDQKTYVYESSEKREAKTGETVTTTSTDTSKGGTVSSDYGFFFTYNVDNSDVSATVAANGTTVLNVRYDRKEITYNFNYGTGTPEYITKNGYELARIASGYFSYDYFIKIDDAWHKITNRGIYVWDSTTSIRSVDTRNRKITFRYYNNDYDASYSKEQYPIRENESYTGLYGSAFTEWPDPGDGRCWYIGDIGFPLALTVYDPANINEDTIDTSFIFSLKNRNSAYYLYIYGQRMDGLWEYNEENELAPVAKLTSTPGYSMTWTPTEKFDGFTIAGYQVGSSLNDSESAWINADPSTTWELALT